MATRYISQDATDTHWGLRHRDGRSVVFTFAQFRIQPCKIRFAGQSFTIQRRRYTRRNGQTVWQIVIDNERVGWDADYAVSIVWPREFRNGH